MFVLLQLIILLGIPALTLYLQQRGLLNDIFSPIILCYLAGILVNNLQVFPLLDALSTQATQLGILLAIPLLLYGTKLGDIRRAAGSSLLSFGLCVVAGLSSTVICSVLLFTDLPTRFELAGMLTGMYTGGTPNMQAIGMALEADQETIILLNATDIVIGGLYLIFLTSVAKRVFARLLPPFTSGHSPTVMSGDRSVKRYFAKDMLVALGVTVLLIGCCVGLGWLLYGSLSDIPVSVIILLLTTASLLAGRSALLQRQRSTFEAGEYFLLVFSVALGLLADLQQIAGSGTEILSYTTAAWSLTVLIHLLLASTFRIDRDTFMISSTAALYGPAFVGQIAAVIGNRSLIFAGIAVGLLGYAVGNYLGIGLAYLLTSVFQ